MDVAAGTRGDVPSGGMSGIEAKAFDGADEVVTFDHGYVKLVRIGALVLGREHLEPGWRWSIHVKPIVGTERCEFHHVAFQLSGRTGFETRDGEVREVVPGQVSDVAPGHDAWVVGDEPAVSIDFEGVLGWAKAPDLAERVLATILFTDIVSSTATAERLGDQSWKTLLSAHYEAVRHLVDTYRGREIDTAGDGFLAKFDTPAHAIACALAICHAARDLGIAVRAGIHTGEVEFSGGQMRGVAVHVAARIMAAAGAHEVLVSATSRELAAGAGVDFVDRGTRQLRGINGRRRLYEARAQSASSRQG